MHSRQQAKSAGQIESGVCALSVNVSLTLVRSSSKLGVEDASALKLVQLPGEAPRASSCWPPGLPAPFYSPCLPVALGDLWSFPPPPSPGGPGSAGGRRRQRSLAAPAAMENPVQLHSQQ